VTDLEIRTVPYDDPAARVMRDAAQAYLAEIYGGAGDDTPLDPAEFAPPGGAFVVAFVDGEPVACGGWRTRPELPDTAEIKRMYAAPTVRGTGVAAAVLRALEESARAAGRRRTALETGIEQPAAIRFYVKHGYELIPNFGYYRDEPACRSFARDLSR
jgi:GNAT superfamily N-acetyltransferase